MPYHPFRSWLSGLLILLLLAGCGGQAAPTRVTTPPAPSATPSARATASSTATITPTTLPTQAPTLPGADTAIPAAAGNTPSDVRPAIDGDNAKQLQILAQWSTGANESHYQWSPDSTRLLLVSTAAVRLIDVQTFQQLWEAPGGDSGQFSEDGSQVGIQNGASTQVLRAADGQPDTSGADFQAAPPAEISLPSKDKPDGGQFLEVQENGTQRELRINACGCAAAVYTDLPAGITGYALSPDGRLLLLLARGLDAQPDYQAVVLGINAGSEPPLPASLGGADQAGFQATRPGLAAPFAPVIPIQTFGVSEFPPPTAAVDGPADAYQLKPLDEASGLAMLKALVAYGVANDVRGPANGTGNLLFAQQALHTGLLEYLARFPQSPNRIAVQWELALNNTLLNSHASDGWIAAQLEGALNRKELSPSLLSLNAALIPFGFYLDATFSSPSKPDDPFALCDAAAAPPWPLVVNNLLDDGRPSLVFMLRTVSSRVGTLFALNRDAGGQYRVFPVGGQWDLYAGMGQDVQTMDLLGDGQPVIRLDYYWHNGSMNGRDTFFYRWQGSVTKGGKFVELTGGIDEGIDGIYPDLQFQGGPGAPKTIVAPKGGVLTFGRVQTLTWNGQQYVSSNHIPLTNDSGESLEWLIAAIVNHQYTEVVDLIKTLPDNLPSRRFFLGYVEALQFHPGQARLALQPLADQASQNSDEFSHAAQAFLAGYHSDTDLARACQAALKVSQKVYCNPVFITRSYLEWLSGTPPGDLPAVLAGYGIQFSSQASLDANGDGRPDWLLGQEPPASAQNGTNWLYPVWLVLSNANGFQYFELYFEPPLSPGYPWGSESYSGGALESASFVLGGPGGKSIQILMVKDGQNALFLRLRQDGGAFAVENLLLAGGMSSYQIGFQKDGSSELILFHTIGGFGLPSSYQWNPDTGTLDQSNYLEHLLLVENNPAEALRIIPGLLDYVAAHPGSGNYLKDYYKLLYVPRLQFFLGLAYELSGDQQNAFSTYYALWKAYPMNTQADIPHRASNTMTSLLSSWSRPG